MTTYLLVHGGFHGAWCWERVTPLIEREGHTTHAITLTGVGERAGEASPAVDVTLHAHDVADAIEKLATERVDGEPIVVVSHSYSGFPVEVALDLLASRGELDAVDHVVHIDSFVPAGGDAILDYFPPDLAGMIRGLAESNGDGWRVPTLDPAMLGLFDEDDLAFVVPRLTEQSFATMEETVSLGADTSAVSRTYLECLVGAETKPFGLFGARARDAGWAYDTLDTGHDAMVTDPEGLAARLVALAV